MHRLQLPETSALRFLCLWPHGACPATVSRGKGLQLAPSCYRQWQASNSHWFSIPHTGKSAQWAGFRVANSVVCFLWKCILNYINSQRKSELLLNYVLNPVKPMKHFLVLSCLVVLIKRKLWLAKGKCPRTQQMVSFALRALPAWEEDPPTCSLPSTAEALD